MRLCVWLLSGLLLWSGQFAKAQEKVIILQGGRVYPSPTATPIDDAVVVIRNGRIERVGTAGKVKNLPNAQVIDCRGKVIVAGFWNSHVHFENGWEDAQHQPAAKLESQLQQMLTRWGFTTVWDLGSAPGDTLALRRRIESGEIGGPQILMAGDIFPLHGHPAYLPASVQTPEAATPAESQRMAEEYLKMGLDGIKLFTGAFMGDKPVINMDTAIAKAAVDVAHAQGRPVFAHPQNREGEDNALNAGVDVIAHTIPTERAGYTTDELEQMKRQHTAMTPTLTLWTTVVDDPAIQSALLAGGVAELKAFFQNGGTVLFGTDVGFQKKYDTAEEFEYMSRAMGWRDVLASLTTAPSGYFKQTAKGRVESGMAGDVVVLDADPASDVRNLAKVAYTIRGGTVIYSASAAK